MPKRPDPAQDDEENVFKNTFKDDDELFDLDNESQKFNAAMEIIKDRCGKK